MPHHRGPHNTGPPESVRRQSERKRGRASAFIVVPLGRNGQGRENRVNKLSVGSLNNFRGPWCVGASPSGLVPGLGGVRAGE